MTPQTTSPEETPSGKRRPRRKSKTANAEAPVEFVYHRSFSLPGAEQRLWGPDSIDINVPRYNLLPDGGEKPTRPARGTTVTAEQEKVLFLRYNFAKHRLSKLTEPAGADPTAARKREIALWRDRAETTRRMIVHANLPLVPSMAKRMRTSGVEFGELISEGYMAVLRCVEKFDVSRGFKFSTYACRAILACFHRMGSKAQTYHRYFPALFDPEKERSDFEDRRHETQRGDAIDAVRQVLRENSANLTEVECKVLQKRFPILCDQKPMTLAQIGKEVNLSNERIRQIESRCLTKLRAAVEERFPM